MNTTYNITFLIKSVATLMFATACGTVTSQTVTVGNVIGCYDNETLVPVYAENLEDIAAITLYISMDTVNAELIGLQDINDIFNGGTFISNQDGNILKITWFSSSSVDLDSGLMFNVNVVFNSGVAELNVLEGSEFSNSNLDIIDITFVNGLITDILDIQPLPVTQSVNLGGSAEFSFDFANIDDFSYQWQINYGQQWQNIVDDNFFNGATTNILKISNVSQDFNNLKFRCETYNDSCSGYTKENYLVVLPASVYENKKAERKIYPNPVNEVLHLTLSNEYSGGFVQVSDINGKILDKYSLSENDYLKGVIDLNMEEYKKGMYLISVFENRMINTFKVIRN